MIDPHRYLYIVDYVNNIILKNTLSVEELDAQIRNSIDKVFNSIPIIPEDLIQSILIHLDSNEDEELVKLLNVLQSIYD